MEITHTRIPLKAKLCDVYIAHQYCDDEYLCGLNQIFLLEMCYFLKHNTHNNNSTQRHTGVDRAGTLLGPVCCYPQVWLFRIFFMHISTFVLYLQRKGSLFFNCSSHFRPAYKCNQSFSCNNV